MAISIDRLSEEQWQETNKIKADREGNKRKGQEEQKTAGTAEDANANTAGSVH